MHSQHCLMYNRQKGKCNKSGGFESSSGCWNISIGPTAPKGVEWYHYPASSGAVLVPWTHWGTRKQNHQQVCKRQRWYKGLLDLSQLWESPGKIWEVGLDVVRLTSFGYSGEVLVILKRQPWEWITGPCPGAKARFLSFNGAQSRVGTGLLTGHNTLRRHLHLMGLSDSPLCTRCGAEDETSAHIQCNCEALASLRHVYLGCSFLDPEDINSISMEAIWNFRKVTGLKGKQICEGITVLTQLYCQIHIISQLHVSALMAIIRLDTASEEKTT